ncbi:MAG: PilZ domain-containing protein [Deltaproteobacteria bacterium]|nr:PilZ domain-containing protein [Deltaproteobacteria bacterium]
MTKKTTTPSPPPPTNTRPQSELRYATGSTGFVEQRRSARLNIPIRIEYTLSLSNAGENKGSVFAKDISIGGCLIELNHELPPDAQMGLSVFLGDGDTQVLHLTGLVARQHLTTNGLYEYGIAFDPLTHKARKQFTDFCFAKMYEMVGLKNWPNVKQAPKQK